MGKRLAGEICPECHKGELFKMDLNILDQKTFEVAKCYACKSVFLLEIHKISNKLYEAIEDAQMLVVANEY